MENKIITPEISLMVEKITMLNSRHDYLVEQVRKAEVEFLVDLTDELTKELPTHKISYDERHRGFVEIEGKQNGRAFTNTTRISFGYTDGHLAVHFGSTRLSPIADVQCTIYKIIGSDSFSTRLMDIQLDWMRALETYEEMSKIDHQAKVMAREVVLNHLMSTGEYEGHKVKPLARGRYEYTYYGSQPKKYTIDKIKNQIGLDGNGLIDRATKVFHTF